MTQHIRLFSLLVILIIGTWGISYLYQVYRTHAHRVILSIAHYTIYIHLLIIMLFVFAYSDLNLTANFIKENIPHWDDFADLFVSLFVIGITFSIFRIAYDFREQTIHPLVFKSVSIFSLIIGVGYIMKMTIPGSEGFFIWLDFLRDYFFENVFIVEPIILITLLFYGKKSPDRERIKIIRAFAWIFIGRYLILMVAVLFYALFGLPDIVRYIFGFGFFLMLSLIPVVWCKYYFITYAESMLSLIKDKSSIDDIFGKYSISNREQEIVKLILDGKSNQEISDTLFIAVHTVKNHIYNLYQKFGVNKRHELVHLFIKLQSGTARKIS